METVKNSPDENFSDYTGLFDGIDFGPDGLSETPPVSHVVSSVADNRRILNLILVIDVSGSMQGQRIGAVNYALENIIKELKKQDDINSVIKLSILKFGGDAEWATPQPMPIDSFVFTKIEATPSLTNYGKAYHALCEKLSKSAYMNPSFGEYFAPVIMFITDGEPTDLNDYPDELLHLKKNGWFNQSARYAIAVGKEARSEKVISLLQSFTNDRNNVRYADEGAALCQLIQFVAIRASQVQTSMISRGEDPGVQPSIFSEKDSSLFGSMFDEK